MDNIFQNFWLDGGIPRGKAYREEQENLGEVLRDEINDYTIDSCDSFDEGYETAIWKGNNDMIIVERYSTKEEMHKGHKKWCEFCKTNPVKAYSVQLDQVCEF